MEDRLEKAPPAPARRSCWANRSKAFAVQVTIIVAGWVIAIIVGLFLYRAAVKDKENEFRLRCLNRKQVATILPDFRTD